MYTSRLKRMLSAPDMALTLVHGFVAIGSLVCLGILLFSGSKNSPEQLASSASFELGAHHQALQPRRTRTSFVDAPWAGRARLLKSKRWETDKKEKLSVIAYANSRDGAEAYAQLIEALFKRNQVTSKKQNGDIHNHHTQQETQKFEPGTLVGTEITWEYDGPVTISGKQGASIQKHLPVYSIDNVALITAGPYEENNRRCSPAKRLFTHFNSTQSYEIKKYTKSEDDSVKKLPCEFVHMVHEFPIYWHATDDIEIEVKDHFNVKISPGKVDCKRNNAWESVTVSTQLSSPISIKDVAGCPRFVAWIDENGTAFVEYDKKFRVFGTLNGTMGILQYGYGGPSPKLQNAIILVPDVVKNAQSALVVYDQA